MGVGTTIGALAITAACLVCGCATSTRDTSSPSTPSASGKAAGAVPVAGVDSSTAAVTTEEAAVEPAAGRMIVRYDPATTPEAIRGRRLMEDTRVMEGLAQEVNDWLKLPYDIPLVGQECGEANDFWDPNDKKMILCYEDVDNSLQIFGGDGDPHADDTARRIVIASFFHELGHMAIDVYDLPATGREEDVADQMAAYVLLQRDDAGNLNPDYVQAAKDTAREYQLAAKDDDASSKDLLADVHTLNQARMYNFECWIYGSDPDANADVVANGMLPEQRADGCENEYNRLARAWSTLLDSHWK